MLCSCSGERIKFEEPQPQSPESLATRDFSASGFSSRIGDWDSKIEDAQVDEAESTLREALSLNYEEARALLGRLEYQKGNFDAALQVFQGIDIRSLSPRMSKAIFERTRRRKSRPKVNEMLHGVMSLHSVNLLLEAILLKSKSLEELGRFKEAARECTIILDTVESALPYGMPLENGENCRLQENFHKSIELLPKLWIKAGVLTEAMTAYRRILIKPWNLSPIRIAIIQKEFAVILLYGGVEASHLFDNTEEALLLLFILVRKVLNGEIEWESEIMDHLTFALSVSGNFETLAEHVEQALPGIYTRAERWYFLALCYSAAGKIEVAVSLLKKVVGSPEARNKPHFHSILLGAKLCSQDKVYAQEGIFFAQTLVNLVGSNQNRHFIGQAHKFLGICYGNAARTSISDSERRVYHKESLKSLNRAVEIDKGELDTVFSLGTESAFQRNLTVAFDSVMLYSSMMAGGSTKGWKLLSQILSAEQRFEDAEIIVDLAIDETEKIDQFSLLRLKAVLQVSQEQPKEAIETYRVLLGLIGAQREQANSFDAELVETKRLEMEAWQDLAKIYIDLESWPDVEICIDRAKSVGFYSPENWHATGMMLKAQERKREALVAFSVSLSIEPDYVPSIVSTAEVLITMGSKSLPIARSFLMNALRLEPTEHRVWMNLGLISKMEGSTMQAAEFFQAAHELMMSAPVLPF
ncbi:protein NPGR1 [Impatiens glandulifera]|uniref:protein NPGR1 n=1 Tax=Impatiens glandulifera TaxID=253017 RepID=UPI001FB128A6|nr:protein NPGR1 [Impatiens glandulifera]XP_047316354.1 protein NPGR1 [Impatiens glandulifera]